MGGDALVVGIVCMRQLSGEYMLNSRDAYMAPYHVHERQILCDGWSYSCISWASFYNFSQIPDLQRHG